ncbi:MAG: hypothetical protein K9G60_04830 [Pseudolabrys sp.]|nr:hypothetical protein [Pseudolabrys sp.]
MKTQFDESADLLTMLAFTVKMIGMTGPDDKQRIANAYQDARSLVAMIGPDDKGSARPRIVACIERFRAYEAADDCAAAGWILTAMQERVAERNLPGWRDLRKIIKGAVRELPPPGKTALN